MGQPALSSRFSYLLSPLRVPEGPQRFGMGPRNQARRLPLDGPTRRQSGPATDQFKHVQRLRRAAAGLLEKLPDELKNSPEAQFLRPAVDHKVYNIVHLIYRAKNYEGHSKDYEFSRAGMEEHWHAGYHDARWTLRHREVLQRPANHEGVFTFDLVADGRE